MGPRSFTFLFVTFVSDICKLLELYFQEFCVGFSRVTSFGRQSLFEGYIKPIF